MNKKIQDDFFSCGFEPKFLVPYLSVVLQSNLFLWGFLNERDYINKPAMIPELKEDIRRAPAETKEGI